MASVGSGPADEDPSAAKPPYPELVGPDLVRPELLGPAPDPATVGSSRAVAGSPTRYPGPGRRRSGRPACMTRSSRMWPAGDPPPAQ